MIKKNYSLIIMVTFAQIFFISIFSNFALNNDTNIVYSQTVTDFAQTNLTNTTNIVNIQDIPLKKVHVGDIEMAYKVIGKGDPIILHNGASDNMDAWDPTLLNILSLNNTVIVFDSRGIGNTTSGTKPYSVQLLANDTSGLMDALKIQQANVLGYSLGTFTTQQFAISYPDKVSSITLIAGTCGGKDNVPRPVNFDKLQSDIVRKSLNNLPPSQEEMESLVNASLGSGWIKLHPESAKIPENITFEQMKPSLSPEAMNNQWTIGMTWMAPDWEGACDGLVKIGKPLLVITGTDDTEYVPHTNALVIVNKVAGAWLIQIKDAGHAVPDQYPEEVGRIVQTFLSTNSKIVDKD